MGGHGCEVLGHRRCVCGVAAQSDALLEVGLPQRVVVDFGYLVESQVRVGRP